MPTRTILRPLSPADEPFIARLYASTRTEELAVLDWSDQQKDDFLAMQFHAQHTFYMREFAGAQFDIIQLETEPVGRLYIERRDQEIRIIDIALLPEYRDLGIGSRYLKEILAEGQDRNLPVTIHVEANNPAMRLYLRLGFHKIDTNGVYWLMEWRPNGQQ